ncbi:MAG TPA: TlpA disulfide reductase family protein [Chitinophagaceae bacterium]|nr:TlpA disulfide reductase family protein [Chitinophagaceae bacterium]
MRKIIILALAIIISFLSTTAQPLTKPDQHSIVKDTLGNTLPYALWNQLLMTGRFKLKTENKDNSEFILSGISDEEYAKKLEAAPKPKESNFFRTGNKFGHFKATDINGNKINTKNLAGKIIVLNYWFIKCPPCVREMPELNHLVERYRTDSSVVFIAIALNQKYDLEQFLKTTRFEYKIIGDGRFIADQNKISSYPTNVVIDQKGKVYFHSTGLFINTAYWINKSIEELRGKEVAKTNLPNNQ